MFKVRLPMSVVFPRIYIFDNNILQVLMHVIQYVIWMNLMLILMCTLVRIHCLSHNTWKYYIHINEINPDVEVK